MQTQTATPRGHDHFWTFRLPTELSQVVTEDATRTGHNISEYIRQALVEKTKRANR